MTFTLENLHDGYVDLVSWLIDTGHRVTSRDLPTIEHTGVTIDLARVDGAELLPIGIERRLNPQLAAVEALQLASGLVAPELVRAAAPTFADVLVDPDNPDYGAYGPRVADQLPAVLDLLRDDPASRRAVVTIWHPRDLTHDGDRPCTLTLQFLVRRSQLELHVTMRSQDVWLGVPYDVFMFTQLQLTLARELNVIAGRYVHHVGSLHIYERDLNAACELRYRDPARPFNAATYPRGVVPTISGFTGLDVAGYLLQGVAGEADRRANHWYVAQLTKLNVFTEADA